MEATDILGALASADLSQVDTSFPVLQAGLYEFRIESAEKKTSERTGGEYLLFQTKLVSEGATDLNGEPVSPGYPIRHMISLTPSAKQLETKSAEELSKQTIQSVCKFLDSFQDTRFWDETLESYIGQTFFAKTKVSKEREDKNTGDVYPPASEFASFVPKQK